MPGAGTDKTKRWVEQPGPVVILVEPQMGENIGSAARAMANFGLSRLRLVKPREEWPNPQARKMASGADRVLDNAELYDSVEAAIADWLTSPGHRSTLLSGKFKEFGLAAARSGTTAAESSARPWSTPRT